MLKPPTMRTAKLLVPLLALALAACAGSAPRSVSGLPSAGGPSRTAGTTAPSRPPAAPVRPSAPQGPLKIAMVGGYMDKLEGDLRRHVRGDGIVVARQGDVLNIVIPNSQLFAESGAVNGDDVLDPLSAILRAYSHTTLIIGGFTDTTGTPEKNLAISQKRAQLIAGALAHGGVAANRIAAQGFGEKRLRIATGDDKNEPRNRRIEIIIKPKPG